MHLSTAVLAASAMFVGSALGQTKLKFMPLGDSITEITCWRATVWDNLKAAGLTTSVEFVGTSSTNTQNCRAQDTAWDKRHEGHSGFQAVNIAKQNMPTWLARNVPDVVNFMLGTNDVNGRRTTDEIIAAFTSIVQQLREKNPKVKVLVDTVIPLPLNQAGINAINARIPAWATAQNTTQSPVYVVDVAQAYPSGNAALRDGVHPNAAGDAVIAAKISPVLIQVLKESLGQ